MRQSFGSTQGEACFVVMFFSRDTVTLLKKKGDGKLKEGSVSLELSVY